VIQSGRGEFETGRQGEVCIGRDRVRSRRRLRIGYAATFPPEMVVEAVDARGYHQIARNLLDGHGFSLQAGPPYRPDSVRTPLYPAFVALVYAAAGPHPEAVVPVQAALDGLTALLVGHRRPTRRLASGPCGCSRVRADAGSDSHGERADDGDGPRVLVGPGHRAVRRHLGRCLSAAERRVPRTGMRPGAWVGGVVQTNVVALPAVYAAGAAWAARGTGRRRAGIQAAVVLLGGALLVIMPWIARNWLIFRQPMLSTAFQDNLARVAAPATLAAARGEQVAPWTPRWEALYGRSSIKLPGATVGPATTLTNSMR